jgi:hypothetical protein
MRPRRVRGPSPQKLPPSPTSKGGERKLKRLATTISKVTVPLFKTPPSSSTQTPQKFHVDKKPLASVSTKNATELGKHLSQSIG